MDGFKILFKIIALLLTGFIVLTCTQDQSPTEPLIDYISPLVEWLYPPGGSELSGVVELRFSVYDEGVIDSACVYINGSLFGEGRHSCLPLNGEGRHSCLPLNGEGRHSCLPTDNKWDGHSCLSLNCCQTASTDTIFSLSWNTLDFADGVYILEARAWDEAGNLGTSPSLVVNVRNGDEPPPEDRMPPDVWWTAPNPGSTLADTVRLQLGVFDEVGVDSVRLLKNGAVITTVLLPYESMVGQRGGEYEVDYLWDTASDLDDVYVWEARAWDRSGNMGTSPALLVRVKNNPEPPPEDTSPPVISWCSPEPGDTLEGTVELRFQALDDVGVDSVKVYLNGREWQNLDKNIGLFLFDVIWITNEYPDGIYIVEVRAWDSSGNMGIGVGVVFTVWNNRPRVIWVPDDYRKIQKAINASEEGDTVRVRAGMYQEGIMISKRLWLESESGPEVTIIDAAGYGFGIYVASTVRDTVGSAIRGFTIRTSDSDGIHLFDGASIRITNNLILQSGRAAIWIAFNMIEAAIVNNTIDGSPVYALYIYMSQSNISNNIIVNADWYTFYNGYIYENPIRPDYNLIWQYGELTNEPPIRFGEHNLIDINPIFIDEFYHLGDESPCIDNGNPDIFDKDGSRSDIGAYGGPYAYPVNR